MSDLPVVDAPSARDRLLAVAKTLGAVPAWSYARAWRAVPRKKRLLASAVERQGSTWRILGQAPRAERVESYAQRLLVGSPFADVGELRAARREVRRGLGHTVLAWLAVVAVVALVLGLIPRTRHLVWKTNIAPTATFRASSEYPGLALPPGPVPATIGDKLLLHTLEQDEPWLELDFAEPRPLHGGRVTNRHDCCGERAVPLVVEVSNDRVYWKPMVRRRGAFDQWVFRIPTVRARFLRFRVEKRTTLHLRGVEIY